MNSRYCVVLAIAVLYTLGVAKGQEDKAFADAKLYDEVVERLFQHDVRPGTPEIQLRYTYCDAGEMQIVIHKMKDSRLQVDVWHVPTGSPNVWNQLARLVTSKPTLSTEAAVALIKMSRYTVIVSSSTTLARLVESADSLSIPLLASSRVTLDGMAYGLAVRSISEDLTLTLQGPQQAEHSESQMIRWMGQMRSNSELQTQRDSKQ
jgi:hypothetical protein